MSKKNSNKSELQFLGRCPLCNRRYQTEEATVLREDEEATMVYVDCVRCRSSVVFAVVRQMGGVIGMVTDMTLEDVRRLGGSRPVSGDDVLETHKHFADVS